MIKIMDIFSSNIFKDNLIDNNINIVDKYREVFSLYRTLLNEVNDHDKSLINYESTSLIVSNLSEMLITATEHYLFGEINKGYSVFSKCLNTIWNKIEPFCKTNAEMITLFRCRIKDFNHQEAKEDIYHIPFDERYKVKNQRYSINGYPCLYFSTSVLGCLYEMQINEKKEHIMSVYRLMNIWPKVLDLTIDYQKITETTLEQDGVANWFIDLCRQGFVSKIVLFPLIFATSIKNMKTDNSFKSEYIIPQYLLEWAKDTQKIDCIRYNSYLNFGNCKQTDKLTNYVFPLKSRAFSGYCNEVLDYFTITNPKVNNLFTNTTEIDSLLANYYQSEIGKYEIALTTAST